jgi:hypothetical protein
VLFLGSFRVFGTGDFLVYFYFFHVYSFPLFSLHLWKWILGYGNFPFCRNQQAREMAKDIIGSKRFKR